MPHLFVDISSHGFGHLAQTAPVLNVLRARLPSLHLTIRCGHPCEVVAQRLVGKFSYIREASDFGMLMRDAMAVDVTASCARYAAFHADWADRVAAERARLSEIAPDAVLANISYLALAGAAAAGIPAVGLCSLTWAEVFYPYCHGTAGAAAIRDAMQTAYASAHTFLRPTPGMDLPGLAYLHTIGPVGRVGRSRRAALNARFGIDERTRLVLVAMGGIAQPLDPMRWPRHPTIRWIAPEASGLVRADVIPLERLPEDFADLIASCDAVLTKSGYGTFVEAAAAGTRVLYVRRPDWPEEPALASWLHDHAHACGIDRAALDAGTFLPGLLTLLDRPRSTPIALTGVDEAADCLAQSLGARGV